MKEEEALGRVDILKGRISVQRKLQVRGMSTQRLYAIHEGMPSPALGMTDRQARELLCGEGSGVPVTPVGHEPQPGCSLGSVSNTTPSE